MERCLDGHGEELKESVIAIEVFGRRPDYNPRHDPIVRTEARRLRARLSDYYLSEGKSDALVIELPKGGYVPRFRETGIASEAGVKAAFRPGWSKLWAACALAGLAAAAGTIAWWRLPRQSAPIPVAVLPLENLNHAAGDDYFSDGLTGEIIRNLAIIDGLAVRSQTSSFAFKGRPGNLRDAAKQLQADYLLEGSVLRAGQRLRINVQLVRALDDSPLWTERYDRVITDVFAIQDEISRAIVNCLRLKLGRGRRRYETSVEAYDLYLRARSLPLEHGFAGHNESVPVYEAAIAKDPSFAPAYAGLAIAHAFRSNQFQFDYAEARARMQIAAGKAIELDPLLGEAHEALAFAYDRDARWKDAEVSFRRALELDPQSSGTRSHFAISHLLPLGRVQEALGQLRIAEKSDPLYPEVHQILAAALLIARQYNEAAVHAEKMPDGSTLKLPWLGRARLFQGRTAEAIELFESATFYGTSRLRVRTERPGCGGREVGKRSNSGSRRAGVDLRWTWRSRSRVWGSGTRR